MDGNVGRLPSLKVSEQTFHMGWFQCMHSMKPRYKVNINAYKSSSPQFMYVMKGLLEEELCGFCVRLKVN